MLVVGPDFDTHQDGFTHAYAAGFVDNDQFNRYLAQDGHGDLIECSTELLERMRAVDFTDDPDPTLGEWMTRRLKAPIRMPDGRLVERGRGTPQGSAVSPVWPTCSCTTRSTPGWSASSRPCSSSGSLINLADVLDGGILIARLPKGEIGEHAAQLVGSLLLSGLWSAATRRATLAPEQRRDATIVVDECHNFLHLPIGVDDALAEARGYRLSLVLAHQHLAQLPADVRDAVDANARNKIFFTVSPNDATKLVRHVAPYFDERDLARRPAFEVVARTVHHGHDVPPFTLATEPLPPPVAGRAEQLREAARRRTGLTAQQRAQAARRRHVGVAPRAGRLGANPGNRRTEGGNRAIRPGQSSGHPAGHSPASQQATYEWPTD